MSIPPFLALLLVVVGGTLGRHISYYVNDAASEPIITLTQERRICAELCMSGLGGEPCGDGCVDIIPEGLPVKSHGVATRQSSTNDTGESADLTRRGACPVLCANRLGYPLCACNNTQPYRPFFKVDYHQICSYFCVTYNYQVYGCGGCDYYRNPKKPAARITNTAVATRSDTGGSQEVDWNAWCFVMCKEGDGGTACYCDLLPMSMHI